MKKITAIILTICLFICVFVSANADTVRVPIDISSMETADLLALDATIHQELATRGKSPTETRTPEATPMSGESEEAANGIDTGTALLP